MKDGESQFDIPSQDIQDSDSKRGLDVTDDTGTYFLRGGEIKILERSFLFNVARFFPRFD